MHFLRPWWFLALIPLLLLCWFLFRYPLAKSGWGEVCDPHLLTYLMTSQKGKQRRWLPILLLVGSGLLMIISLAGPAWVRMPVPTYQFVQPRVIVLDLSPTMLEDDLSPNRLSRAKFTIHDLLQQTKSGQFGLVVYTGEAFVVSPLTDDARTIDSLLSSLTPDIMPVSGNRLELALQETQQLLTQAGFSYGRILVMTAQPPSIDSINEAKKLAKQRIETSVMPMLAYTNLPASFSQLATAGQGQVVTPSSASALNNWLTDNHHTAFRANHQQQVPIWRDEGRWFLIPALLLLLPVFRRGWLESMS